ncbi:MAG: hypothetical protein AB7O66_03430 [Limisphaerales bacterium]
MSDTPDVKSCATSETTPGVSAPHTSLHYHFGMLLGVTDFETEQAYHRGKMWLHNAWLHREGVVWGFNVIADPEAGEIKVTRGLALDRLGRELHLEADACLTVAAWFAAHRNDPGFEFTEADDGTITFDAHVVIRFKTCLTRQVPALAEPCDHAGAGTAYSREFETVEILLRPGLAPEREDPYHRLRLFMGLSEPERDPESGEILPADLAVLQAPRTLEQFRRLAALDEIDLVPPEPGEFPVPLANITGITLEPTANGTSHTLSAATVDVGIRPSHVATSTIQELLAGARLAPEGPRVVPDSVLLTEGPPASVALRLDRPLAPPSVTPDVFSLTAFDPATGWVDVALDPPALSDGDSTITLNFTGPLPAGALVRFIVRGSGSKPLLGADLAPFNHGQDFVHDQRN